jgi:hypothetical protein
LRHLRATTQSQSVNQCQVFAGVQLKRHREDGPAIIRYDAKTGDIIEQEFFINGKSTKPDNAPSSP